ERMRLEATGEEPLAKESKSPLPSSAAVPRNAVSSPDPAPDAECGFAAGPQVSAGPSEGYYYQLAAFVPRDKDAPDYLGKLASTGLPIALQKAIVSGSTYCRVLVGPYSKLSQALQAETHITEVAASCSKECGVPFLR